MKQCRFSYVYFLLSLLVLSYLPSHSLISLTPDNSSLEKIEDIIHAWELTECPADYMTPEELVKSIRQHKIAIKSDNVKKKVLNKKNSLDKLITLTGDIDKDFDKIISLLETSKNIDWKNWKLIMNPRCFPEIDPVVIRSDYITEINGYRVRAVFTTYIDTKQAFLINAWVVK